MRAGLVVALLAMGLGACDASVMPTVQEGALRYVALGDSYTIGTSVSSAESWPSQLVTRVPQLQLVANLGVNGYTARDLIEEELPALAELEPEFVTLMIGVNDVVQRVPEAAYTDNLTAILNLLFATLPPERVLCVASPDYTVTPQGAAFGPPEEQRAGIAQFNLLMQATCAERGVRFVTEIFDISERAANDLTLVAGDGLHPSGAQYALWVDAIAPVVEELLGG